MKGIIPAAGKGTRMKPFTNAVPKELLPVGDRAVIEHSVLLMREAGITDIIVVVGWKKHAIIDYLGSGERLNVDIHYAVQEHQNGLGGAIQAGKKLVAGESFAVALGDSYFTSSRVLQRLRQLHEESGSTATLAGFSVEDPSSYGVISHTDGEVKHVVEKPPLGEAPSSLAIAGAYIFENPIFSAIEEAETGREGELQLTDGIQTLIQDGETVQCQQIDGEYIDVGTPGRLKKANRNALEEE